jgi:hypothetical protein
MKSLMVGLRSAARFAARWFTALIWAGGSSRRGFWADCGLRAVEGSSHGFLGGAAFLVTGCVPARAFVLVLWARFAPTCLVPTFVVALAGLPLRAGFFFADAFFRLEGTARALDVLPREPAAPLFFFGLRVGMAISSCARWSAFRHGAFATVASSTAARRVQSPTTHGVNTSSGVQCSVVATSWSF